MHGNVWEWCEDLYDAGDLDCVNRGGSWGHGSRGCRASRRSRSYPDYRNDYLGFRLAASKD